MNLANWLDKVYTAIEKKNRRENNTTTTFGFSAVSPQSFAIAYLVLSYLVRFEVVVST